MDFREAFESWLGTFPESSWRKFHSEDGYLAWQAAIHSRDAEVKGKEDEIVALREALEFYSKESNFAKTVWDDDEHSGPCHMVPFELYELNEIYGPDSHGEFGIIAEEALGHFNLSAPTTQTAIEGEGEGDVKL